MSSEKSEPRNPRLFERVLRWGSPEDEIEFDKDPHRTALLRVRRGRRKVGQYHGLFVVFLGLGFVLLGAGVSTGFQTGGTESLWFLLLLIAGSLCLVLTPAWKSRYRDWCNRLDDAEFEAEVLNLERSDPEAKADRLWRMNASQLGRYHEMNLQQNAWIFALAIGCIALGATVVLYTLWLFGNTEITGGESVVTAVVAGIGSILTNFVAVIFLRLHSSSSKNLARFHEKLAGSQRLLLSNVIASQIVPEDQRWVTYAELARAFSRQTGEQAIDAGGDDD